jgi:putative oxidoreductase
VLEIAGAVALLIPRFCGLAALAFVGLMVGAVIATVIGVGAGMAAVPAAVLALVPVVARARRNRAAALVASVSRHLR